MSAPHADRDHSEQPCCGDYNHEPCRGCPDGRDAGTSRSGAARVVRASEAQVVAARRAFHESVDGGMFRAVADAVVAAGDADEVTRLRADYATLADGYNAQVQHARRHRVRAEAAEAERDEVAGRLSALLCELTRGRLSKPTYDVRTMVAEVDSVYDDAQQEERAERDRLAEVVARVEALFSGGPDTPCRTAWANDVECVEVPLDELRAALSGPTPAQTPRNGPEPALSREQGASGQSGEGEALRGAEKGEQRCCGHVRCPGGSLCCCQGEGEGR